MPPLLILFIGMIIVIGGILWLRLHAFLALILAALVVSFLTPGSTIYENELQSHSVAVQSITDQGRQVTLGVGSSSGVLVGSRYLVLRKNLLDGTFEHVATLEVTSVDASSSQGALIGSDRNATVQPGDLVIHPIHQREAQSISSQNAGEQVATGFGRTSLSIGILIAMAAVIGKCLLDSGGAERIVWAIHRLLGEKRSPLALISSGFVVGIPVFFDTVFYLLLPLGKAMFIRTGKNYLLLILSIVAGATMAHSLVPPTPGPLFVAAELNVEIGLMMLGGLIVGILAVSVGYTFAVWANRRWVIPFRPSVDMTEEQLEAMKNRDMSTLPPLWFSLLPILLPVVLIAGNTVWNMVVIDPTSGMMVFGDVLDVLGNKNIALCLGAALSLIMLAQQISYDKEKMVEAVQTALASGGIIILITAAGGAFGHVLRLTGIATAIQDLVPAGQTALLPLAFIITALVRVAQGSATVAMITSVGIMGPMVAAGGLAFHPLYLALAIGCGSKPLPWMNDSGFWVITKMSGMTEGETLKTVTVMMTLMGIFGLIVTMIGAWLFPLV